MKKIRAVLLALILVAAAAFSFVAYRFLHEEYAVDQCLSAQHGSFNYSSMGCDLQENHAYVPYTTRHPYDEPTALNALVALALFLSAYIYVVRKERLSTIKNTCGS